MKRDTVWVILMIGIVLSGCGSKQKVFTLEEAQKEVKAIENKIVEEEAKKVNSSTKPLSKKETTTDEEYEKRIEKCIRY